MSDARAEAGRAIAHMQGEKHVPIGRLHRANNPHTKRTYIDPFEAHRWTTSRPLKVVI